ncbi:Uma2 family endonuclease [Peterkaempfera griseoplana]|uniref:Uma2 family endonuclease n=1 Tax=Peterkaempfera griseoplana TaxID=66896 RepID=UPI0007C830D4|nr:Uma2 family endonuclease [Peterkaempfera griseoplana]
MSTARHIEDHAGLWTVDEVLALDEHPTGNRYELVDGALIMSPAPGWAHQDASRTLANQLDRAVRAAEAPFRVAEAVNVRSESRLFVPDVVVADRAAVRRDTTAVPMEAALLLVEIVSPFNTTQDRILKPALYAQAGIPAYWRLELEPEPHLVVHELCDNTYREVLTVKGRQTVQVGGAFTAELDLGVLLADFEDGDSDGGA